MQREYDDRRGVSAIKMISWKIPIKKDILLTIGIIFIILALPNQRGVATIIISVLSLFFALTYKNNMKYFIALVILVHTQYFSLIGTYLPSFAGIGCSTILVLATALIVIQTKAWKSYTFNIIAAFFVLNICSVVVAWLKYGQPIMIGLMPYLRTYFVIFLAAPIAKYIFKEASKETIIDYCFNMVFIACCILAINYFFIPESMSFLDVKYVERYTGNSGYLIHTVSPLICFCLAVKIIIKKLTLIDWFKLGIIVFTLTFVAQTRIFIFGAAISIFSAVYLFNNRIKKNNKLIIFLIICAVVLPIASNVISILTEHFLGNVIERGNEYIRVRELLWFDEVNIQPKWLGIGIANTTYTYTPYYKGINSLTVGKYYVSDLGVLGMFFEYGIQGIIGLLILIVGMKKYALKYGDDLSNRCWNCLLILIASTAVTVSPMQYLIPIIICSSFVEYDAMLNRCIKKGDNV